MRVRTRDYTVIKTMKSCKNRTVRGLHVSVKSNWGQIPTAPTYSAGPGTYFLRSHYAKRGPTT